MGLPIPNVMLTDAIKRSKSYQMFIKYSTNQIPPKKSRGKAKKKTSGKRRVKKKVTLSPDDNIISDDPNAALELAKSISQTEAEEAEAARKVHATHARIVTESVPESAKKKSSGRSSKSVVIQDTPSTPKSKPATSKTKLKGAPSLTPQEQEAADIMQALKESKKSSRRQLGTEGLNEGTGSKPGVPDESIVGDEQDSQFSDDDNDDVEKDDKDGDADDECDDHVSDTQDADDEDVKTESDEDEIYKYNIRVRNEEDVEMKDAKVEESDKGEEKVTNAAKEEAEKTSEAKDDTKKSKLPPSSSSLYISSGFGDQFLKLSSDSSLVSAVKDSIDADVSSLLDIPMQHETPQTQSPSIQKIPISVITHNTQNLPPIPEFVMKLQFSTVVFSIKVTPIFSSMQQTPTPIPTPPITTDSPTVTTVVPKSNALTVHLPELPKKPTPTSEQEFEKSPSDILKIKRERAEKQKMSQFTIKSIDKAALEDTMHHEAFDEMKMQWIRVSLIQLKTTRESHVDDKDSLSLQRSHPPPRKPQKVKLQLKDLKLGKSASAKEPVEEPIAEVVMDDVGDDVAHDDYQPQDTSEPKTRKTLNTKWFKQPLRPPTPDPEWNKRQVILDQPAQPWFNQMVSALKDPLTFNDLMATPIDFSKYVLNGLKIDNLTQDILIGHALNLLKGT
ncbi:hypothetical protein Tco_0579394 [Tanacetum coccineum]